MVLTFQNAATNHKNKLQTILFKNNDLFKLQISTPQNAATNHKKLVVDNCMYLLHLILQPALKRDDFLEDFKDNLKLDNQKIIKTINSDWAMVRLCLYFSKKKLY